MWSVEISKKNANKKYDMNNIFVKKSFSEIFDSMYFIIIIRKSDNNIEEI
jgi:hypothetical protein